MCDVYTLLYRLSTDMMFNKERQYQGGQVMFFYNPYPFLWHTVAYIARPRAPSSTAAMLRKLVISVVIYAFATIINISHVFAKLD